MNDTAIDIQSVAKSYRSQKVLNDLTLSVPTGKTFAFLGRNGAGKTTTIRMLLGQLKPNAGQLRILGLDVARQPLEVRRRIGYLAEDQQMFGWMKVAQILKFMKPFYPTWDDTLADKYLQTFELPPKTRIKHLSKGQNCRLGLLLALAHRPELVILDDPTLGLDPIMRKELLRDVIDHLQGQGVTVFFSWSLSLAINQGEHRTVSISTAVLVASTLCFVVGLAFLNSPAGKVAVYRVLVFGNPMSLLLFMCEYPARSAIDHLYVVAMVQAPILIGLLWWATWRFKRISRHINE